MIDADFSKFVDQNGGLHAYLIAENVVQQGGFSSTQESAEDGDGHLRGRRACHYENDSHFIVPGRWHSCWCRSDQEGFRLVAFAAQPSPLAH